MNEQLATITDLPSQMQIAHRNVSELLKRLTPDFRAIAEAHILSGATHISVGDISYNTTPVFISADTFSQYPELPVLLSQKLLVGDKITCLNQPAIIRGKEFIENEFNPHLRKRHYKDVRLKVLLILDQTETDLISAAATTNENQPVFRWTLEQLALLNYRRIDSEATHH